jgi:hypothetical protein
MKDANEMNLIACERGHIHVVLLQDGEPIADMPLALEDAIAIHNMLGEAISDLAKTETAAAGGVN